MYAGQTTPVLLLLRSADATCEEMPCPWEKGKTTTVRSVDAPWRRLGPTPVRWVGVYRDHAPPLLLLSTDRTLSPRHIAALYSHRWQIELTFRGFKHTLFGFCYRFWSKAVPKAGAERGDLVLQSFDKEDRAKIVAKVKSYDYFLQTAVIAQGLLHLVAVRAPEDVVASLRHYVRTIRPGRAVSEFVTGLALKGGCLSEFLVGTTLGCDLEKFIVAQKLKEQEM